MIDMREERPPIVRFERIAVEDIPASKAAGRYVAKDIDMALVTPPYSKDVFKQEAKDWLESMKREVDNGRLPPKWMEIFEKAYEAFRNGQEIPLNGTPIRGWGVISPAQQENLIRVNILTIEDLAKINEEGVRRIGMGAQDLQRKAQAWLAQVNDKGPLTMKMAELESENALLKSNVATLTGKVDELLQALNTMNKINPQAVEPTHLHESIQATDIIDDPDGDLVAAYTRKFGQKPHHRMKPETIRQALQE